MDSTFSEGLVQAAPRETSLAVEYTLSHMGLDASLRRNVRTREYEGGHMMYIDKKELAKLHQDVATFLQDSIAR